MSERELVLRPKHLRYLLYLALGLAFTVIGGFMIAEGLWHGWSVAVIFGSASLVFSALLLPGAAFLRLSEEGFTMCSLYRRHSFKWTEVGPFVPGRVGGQAMVLFDLLVPSRRPRLRALSRGLFGAEAGLSETYGMSAAALADLMNDWRERAASET